MMPQLPQAGGNQAMRGNPSVGQITSPAAGSMMGRRPPATYGQQPMGQRPPGMGMPPMGAKPGMGAPRPNRVPQSPPMGNQPMRSPFDRPVYGGPSPQMGPQEVGVKPPWEPRPQPYGMGEMQSPMGQSPGMGSLPPQEMEQLRGLLSQMAPMADMCGGVGGGIGGGMGGGINGGRQGFMR